MTDIKHSTNGLLCCQNIINLYFAVKPTALGAYIILMLNNQIWKIVAESNILVKMLIKLKFIIVCYDLNYLSFYILKQNI
jgi:hypothetical protein